MSNVDKGLDALIAPKRITLGDVARLERIRSPLLAADFSSLAANLSAILALRMDADEFVAKADALANPDALDAEAIRLGDGLTMDGYRAELERLVQGLVDFGVLMPRPDEDAKKNEPQATDG